MNTRKILLTLTTATLAAYLAAASTKVVISGSDLIGPFISDSTIKIAGKSGVDLEVAMYGTYEAYDNLKAGKADLAIIAVPQKAKLPEGYIAFPFAYQAAVVIVNSVNPLEEISTTQLFDIYSIATQSRSETWQQVGVKNIGLRNILAVTTNLSDNVVVELFKYAALNGTNIGPWVNVAENKAAIYNMIKSNNSAIAIVGKFTEDGNNLVKVVAVSKSGEDASKNYAFRPDQSSLFNGDYPMSLPFYIVFKKDKIEKIKPLLRILLGDDLAKKIDASDFYSAPQNSRKKSIFDLDMMK